jgi:hypothetical protein
MVFNPKEFRNKDGIGMPADDAATDSTSDWTAVSMLKGIYAKLAGTIVVSAPVGGATEAKQDTSNAALASIDTKLTTQAGYLDDVETAIASTNTKLDSSITQETAVNTILGTAADAASTTTTVKAALRGIATALGITALDLGSGTGGSRTLRFFRDTAQWIGGNGAVTSATQRVAIADYSAGEYETVAASQTAQVIGATGAAGDFICGLLVVPASTSPGNVLLLDNATSITVFAGGAASVSNLVPFFVPLGMTSVSGAWKVTTGASVSVIAIGNFT